MTEKQHNPVDLAIAAVGSQTKLARRVGITSQNVCVWRRRGYIPLERVPTVAKITGIPAHMLRPDKPEFFPPPPSRIRKEEPEHAA